MVQGMSDRVLAACVQLTSGADVGKNLETCARLCREARERGASLAVLPENFAFMGLHEADKFAVAETLGDGAISAALRDIARQCELWLIAGGMPERTAEPGKVYNTLVTVAPDGRFATHYRKIHLFDVDIPGGAQFKESGTVLAGADPVLLETPWAKVGLSICYDLRFPELYRNLTAAGARVVVVPAAFTLHTGKDHWHALLRARAIENQVYVLAAGQYGRHNEQGASGPSPGGAVRASPPRVTYGHSVIIDPWGTVLAEAPDRECVIVAELDLAFQDKVRRELPCLGHRRL
jgi:deaminated glutathione amidase